MRVTRRRFVQGAAAVAGTARAARGEKTLPRPVAEAGKDMVLWFRQPAERWADALPVGNGRLGGMVFGGVTEERIGLNDDTLWSGQPRDWNNPQAKQHLPVVRRDVLVDKNYQAADAELRKMQGPYNEAYEPLGDLVLAMEHDGAATGYMRSLDMDSAVARVSYSVDGVAYVREVFSSSPDNVLVVRLTASRPGALTFSAKLTSKLRAKASADGGGGALMLQGKAPAVSRPSYLGGPEAAAIRYSDAPGEGMYFAGVLRCEAQGGAVTSTEDGALHVAGATSAVLVLGTATGWRGYAVAPDMPAEAVLAAAEKPVEAARARRYEELRSRHVADHRALFRRVTLTLGDQTGQSKLPLDERVEGFAAKPDASLPAMFFHYGRYLMIASSRPGTQPATLQGIWNTDLRPAWSSNYTANINIQMNYWPAETCNLSECALPLIAMVGDLSVNGAKTAAVNYGAKGWVSHHNIDGWRQSAPVGEGTEFATPTWANFCMSGPWLCSHLWEHYRFTGDVEYLRKTAYPIMRGAAEFCLSWLIDDGAGGLTTCPSVSTENVFRAPNGKDASCSAGCTMDVALMHEIFARCAEAAQTLGVDDAMRAEMAAATKRLPPYKVGRWGQLQEWSIDFDEAIPGQRHLSHLYPVYPGDQITYRRTPVLARAAQTSLERRMKFAGGNNPFTGWGRAWGIALWARFGNGERAGSSMDELIKHSTNINLFDDILDTHPANEKVIPVEQRAGLPEKAFVFQIDANFGATAAVAEMLLQSHEEELALLPALPAAWAEGSITGLRGRGGLEVDLTWRKDGSASAEVRSLADRTLKLRAPEGRVIQRAVRRGKTMSEGAELLVKKGDVLRVTMVRA